MIWDKTNLNFTSHHVVFQILGDLGLTIIGDSISENKWIEASVIYEKEPFYLFRDPHSSDFLRLELRFSTTYFGKWKNPTSSSEQYLFIQSPQYPDTLYRHNVFVFDDNELINFSIETVCDFLNF